MPATRRSFLKAAAGGVLAGAAGANAATPPGFLAGVADAYAVDPRAAAVEWFRQAKFGLFLHYGLYSLEGRGEWLQLREKIPVAEYAKLKDRFTAENFDADAIADLAVAAGCKYVNLTTRHHDCFCLFKTEQTEFNSLNSPAGRDLVGEMVEACRKRDLGIYLYYSHGRDWRHPHAPNNGDWGGNARPQYDPPEPFYAYGEDSDLQKYIDFMSAQINELLTNYGPIGGIWLDGFATPASRRAKMDQFQLPQLYEQIRAAQPQVLISYKQGLLGTEDFFAPERNWKGGGGKPIELCDTLLPHSWGHKISDDGRHKTAEQALGMLKRADAMGANLLLNTGPLGDGSIHPEDLTTLTELGRLQQEG